MSSTDFADNVWIRKTIAIGVITVFTLINIWSVNAMAFMSSILILIGGLQLILEFGSITFMLLSLLMAFANYIIKHITKLNAQTKMGYVFNDQGVITNP